MKSIQRFLALLLLVCSAFAISTTALAADEDFSFNITTTKGNTTSWIDVATANKKVYAFNDGTIKCSTNNAPGYGYFICLANKKNYVAATVSQWLSYSGQKRYLAYFSGHNIEQDYFHACGRFDNDYSGTYTATGKYNADKT